MVTSITPVPMPSRRLWRELPETALKFLPVIGKVKSISIPEHFSKIGILRTQHSRNGHYRDAAEQSRNKSPDRQRLMSFNQVLPFSLRCVHSKVGIQISIRFLCPSHQFDHFICQWLKLLTFAACNSVRYRFQPLIQIIIFSLTCFT